MPHCLHGLCIPSSCCPRLDCLHAAHSPLQVDTSGTAKAVVQSFNKMGLPYTEVKHCLCCCHNRAASAVGIAVWVVHLVHNCKDAEQVCTVGSSGLPCRQVDRWNVPKCVHHIILQEEIEKVRTVDEQVGRMGVPEQWVDAGHAFHTYTLTSPDGSGERIFVLPADGWCATEPALHPATDLLHSGWSWLLCSAEECTMSKVFFVVLILYPCLPCSGAGVQAQRVRPRGVRRGHG